MIQSQDFEYIGLKRVVSKDANYPEFSGMVNDHLYRITIINRGTVKARKDLEDEITITGFNKEKLIEVTGFKEPHESVDLPDSS